MDSKSSKPNLQGVLDLGLREVGVRNNPRKHALQFGKTSLQGLAFIFVSSILVCVVLGSTGVGAWAVLPLAIAVTAGLVALAWRSTKRAPVAVVKVTADGTNQAAKMLAAPFLPFALVAIQFGSPLMILPLALTAVVAVVVWRNRDCVPAILRKLRPLLGEDEAVLGDGVGRNPAVRGWDKALQLVVATDRRLILAGSTRSDAPFPLVDVPYAEVSRFGIEWKYMGRFGELSLTVEGAGGEPSETHVIGSITPANLVSIAEALASHGVQADDPEAVAAAARAWAEARGQAQGQAQPDAAPRAPAPATPRRRLLDRAAMNTPEFDHGLWLLLGLATLMLYVNPFGIGIGADRDPTLAVLPGIPVLCALGGYMSRTRSSLAYIAPINLLVAPAFFFWPASYVIGLMIVLSAVAAVGLWTGAALRTAMGTAPAAAATSGGRPIRGSLAYTLSGQGLIRIAGIMLAGLMALIVTASAAGLELTSLRLAIEERNLTRLPVDGRSNLNGEAASIKYTRGPDLNEFITDDLRGDAQTDGARWELRSKLTKGYNILSLAHYIYDDPALDNPDAVAAFVARKDREHAGLAGSPVTHTSIVVRGRRGYVWNHGSQHGYWFYAAWFPHPVHTVRLECIAKRQEDRFRGLCREALRSLTFRE